MLCLAICLLSLLPCVLMAPTPAYPNMKQLDSKFVLYWEANSTYIMFETHVNANGWVGFGFSETGLMFPGDVIISWVERYTVQLGDYHTTQHGPANLDASQDWTLYSYSESTADGTILQFGRPLNTNDTDDMVIHPGMNHVIYAWTDVDPVNNNVGYHGGVNRGSAQIDLLEGIIPVGK